MSKKQSSNSGGGMALLAGLAGLAIGAVATYMVAKETATEKTAEPKKKLE